MGIHHYTWDYKGYIEAGVTLEEWVETLMVEIDSFESIGFDTIVASRTLKPLLSFLTDYHKGKLGKYNLVFDDNVKDYHMKLSHDGCNFTLEVLNFDIFLRSGTTHILYDNRGVFFNPFDEKIKTLPTMNPSTLELFNKWEDGYHFTFNPFSMIAIGLFKSAGNKVVECYRVDKIKVGEESIYDKKTTYFFDQDCSGHWFMIPKEKKELWGHVCNMDEDDPKTWVAYEEFEEYRLGGGIQDIYFTVDN